VITFNGVNCALFFNERFEFVEECSSFKRVVQPGNGTAPLVLANIKAPKNGYANLYLSNESDEAVYLCNRNRPILGNTNPLDYTLARLGISANETRQGMTVGLC